MDTVIKLKNSKFYKGERVIVNKDIRRHFGGYIKKGDKGTVLLTEVIGPITWTKVKTDEGLNMSFPREDDLEQLKESENE